MARVARGAVRDLLRGIESVERLVAIASMNFRNDSPFREAPDESGSVAGQERLAQALAIRLAMRNQYAPLRPPNRSRET